MKERKDKLNKQLQQNEQWLKRTQDEIKLFENEDSNGDTGETESYFTVYQASCSYQLKSNELQQECKYYKKSLQNYEAQRKREKRYGFNKRFYKTMSDDILSHVFRKAS